MSMTDQFLMAMKAYQELKAEGQNNGAALAVIPQVTQPSPAATQTRSLPGGSILLGLAEDGLPLLLNVYDPTPGPILIAGDQGIVNESALCAVESVAATVPVARAEQVRSLGDDLRGRAAPALRVWR